jgi:hypothetical protein
MKSKYMKALEVTSSTDHKEWKIVTKKDDQPLGWVNWFPRWKLYVFEPWADTVFSSGCLQDIITFINQIGG